MKITSSEIEKIAVRPDQYPEDNLPEIAFAGRSNVGKSSFINAMINRKSLARTSGTPGKTRTLNFYNINKAFRFVDLPGYGYAKVSKADREKWGKFIDIYLKNRVNLKEIILVVDIRHEPSNQDVMMYNWIKSKGFSGFVIATKSDKINKGKFNKNLSIIIKKLEIENKELVIPFSSEKKHNVDIAWELLEQVLEK